MPIFAITQYKLSHPHSGPIHPTLVPTKCVWCYPQSHKPGKWQLIVDLSAPEGYSINDFIDKVLPFGLHSVPVIFICILCIEVDSLIAAPLASRKITLPKPVKDFEWWYQMVSTWNASKSSPRHRKTLHLGQ